MNFADLVKPAQNYGGKLYDPGPSLTSFGGAFAADARAAFALVAVPEPSGVGLLLGGVAVAVGRRVRRRR